MERADKLHRPAIKNPSSDAATEPIDGESSIFIPEELANKILVLGYIP